MEKRKAKKREEQLPSRLLFASSFEFISPHPVEECAYRLHEMNQKRTGLFSPKLAAIDVFSHKGGEYRFCMRSLSKLPSCAIGDLSASNEDSTLVVGQVGAPLEDLLPIVGLYAALVLLFAIPLPSSAHPELLILTELMWTGIFCMSLLGVLFARSVLVKLLKSCLETTA